MPDALRERSPTRLRPQHRVAQGQVAGIDPLGQRRLRQGQQVRGRQWGDSDRALELGQRALAIANRLNDAVLQTWVNYSLGWGAQTRGSYHQGAQLLKQVAETLQSDRRYERLIGPQATAHSRALLIWCLAELGEFAEAMAHGAQTLQIAREVDQPGSLVLAYRSLGFVFLRRGAIAEAIPPLEYAVKLCRVAQIRALFAIAAAHLGYAYALSGRLPEGVTVIEEAVADPEATGTACHPLLLAYLGEAHLLAGRRDEAAAVTRRALDLAHRQQERGNEAWVLRLLGDTAGHANHPDLESAEGHYTQALARANELEMRPLAAHCHLGLGKLFHRTGDRARAAEHLTTAARMYREMDMGFWLERAEAELGSPLRTHSKQG